MLCKECSTATAYTLSRATCHPCDQLSTFALPFQAPPSAPISLTEGRTARDTCLTQKNPPSAPIHSERLRNTFFDYLHSLVCHYVSSYSFLYMYVISIPIQVSEYQSKLSNLSVKGYCLTVFKVEKNQYVGKQKQSRISCAISTISGVMVCNFYFATETYVCSRGSSKM